MRASFFAVALVLLLSCSSDDDANTTLSVTWKFESGDCAANKVDKVRITFTPPGGAATPKEFACSAGTGELGKITAGTYAIQGEGLDAGGVARFTSTQSASFPDGKVGGPLDMTFRPRPSNVNVTWNGCPGSTILPYQVAIYRGATTTTKVKETQASCQAKKATLESIPPGEYTVEVDSRAVSPAVKGTANVTVVAGQDADVSVPVP